MTTELRDPMAATSLDELCEILNELAEAKSHRDPYDVDDDAFDIDTTSLPTFGGDHDGGGVYSWDATRLLIPGGQITVDVSGWEIVDRD